MLCSSPNLKLSLSSRLQPRVNCGYTWPTKYYVCQHRWWAGRNRNILCTFLNNYMTCTLAFCKSVAVCCPTSRHVGQSLSNFELGDTISHFFKCGNYKKNVLYESSAQVKRTRRHLMMKRKNGLHRWNYYHDITGMLFLAGRLASPVTLLTVHLLSITPTKVNYLKNHSKDKLMLC